MQITVWFCVWIGATMKLSLAEQENINPLIFATSDCFLTEPVYKHNFNFTDLRSDFGRPVDGNKNDKFTYNICGNLSRKCNNKVAAACFTRNGNEYVLGTKHELNYHNGKMYLSFSNGDNCPNRTTEKLRLNVFLRCDYTLDKIQSQITSYADNACSFYITLETPLACLPEPDEVKSNACTAKDLQTGHVYDLLPLSDYNYRTSDRAGGAFIINVCKPVLYTENAMCPPGSSVCFVALHSNDLQTKFINYGTVQTNPTIENGRLVMRYTSNTVCNSTNNHTSIVYFNCDLNAKMGDVKFMGKHGCVYEFSFFTPLACFNLPPCSVATHGSEIINLSLLQDKPITLQMKDKNYTFAVCSNAGTPCLESDGACYTTANGQSTSLGRSNAQLRFKRSGYPYLLYESGATCRKSSTSTAPEASTYWSTRIEFVCLNNGSLSSVSDGSAPIQEAKIVENSNCQLLIHYQTELACQEQIACQAKVYVDGTYEEDVVDLTPLINTRENYEAKINLSNVTGKPVGKTTKFFLNVCRPLVPKYGLGCPGGSAACMAKLDASISPTPEEEQSLGFPLASPVALNRTTMVLRYLQGSACLSDKDQQLSSGIYFYCDMRAGLGVPMLTSIMDCHYQFVWATNVICPPHMCNFDEESCEIINEAIAKRYNLKQAPYMHDSQLVVEKESSEKLTLDICGKNRKAQTDYSQGMVNLFFASKGRCGDDDIVNVHMRIICHSSNNVNYTLNDLRDTQCNLIYTLYTTDICEFLGLTIPPITGSTRTTMIPNGSSTPKTPDDGAYPHLPERTGSVGAILAAILSLTCFVACFGILAFSPERRNSLRRLFRRRRTAVRYSRVQSAEEANLLLEPNGAFTDSDDDMLL